MFVGLIMVLSYVFFEVFIFGVGVLFVIVCYLLWVLLWVGWLVGVGWGGYLLLLVLLLVLLLCCLRLGVLFIVWGSVGLGFGVVGFGL